MSLRGPVPEVAGSDPPSRAPATNGTVGALSDHPTSRCCRRPTRPEARAGALPGSRWQDQDAITPTDCEKGGPTSPPGASVVSTRHHHGPPARRGEGRRDATHGAPVPALWDDPTALGFRNALFWGNGGKLGVERRRAKTEFVKSNPVSARAGHLGYLEAMHGNPRETRREKASEHPRMPSRKDGFRCLGTRARRWLVSMVA